METTAEDQFDYSIVPLPEKPGFLKTLCILSFVCGGLTIIIFTLGSMTLFLNDEMINKIWGNVLKSQPKFESFDRFEFFHAFGFACVYSLIANIISLIGVGMMWQLNKIGFFVYVIAELGVNFFSMKTQTGSDNSSYNVLIFVILLDLVFIFLYALNLKHMRLKTQIVNN